MKREIKFRAKELLHKEWIYGGVAEDRYGNTVIFPKNDWSKGGCVDKDTVGQFTGLLDRNNREIYEGDIVNFTFHSDMWEHSHLENRPEITRPQIVEMHDCKYVLHDFTLDKENVTYFNPPLTWNFRNRYEVIGNVHDNPELLKGDSL